MNMKRFILPLIILFVSSFVFAKDVDIYAKAPADVKVRLQQADSLIKSRNFDSGFKALGEDDNEYIVAKKIDLLTSYFVVSNMHVIFGLKDLSDYEDLNQLRRGGDYTTMTMVAYDPAEVAKKFADSSVVKLALATYYADAFLRYGGQWTITPPELFEKFTSNYDKAYAKGVYDYDSTVVVAEACCYFRRFDKASQYYETAVKLVDNSGQTWYNLAVSYMYTQKYGKAVKAVKKALKDPESSEKSVIDAYMVLADAYNLDNKLSDAEKTYIDAKKKFPENAEPSLRFGEWYMKHNKKQSAYTEFESIFAKQPKDVVYDEIIRIYLKTGSAEDALMFTKLNLAKVENDSYMTFLLNYYIVQLYGELEDKANCLANIDGTLSLLEKTSIKDDAKAQYKEQLLKYKEHLSK